MTATIARAVALTATLATAATALVLHITEDAAAAPEPVEPRVVVVDRTEGTWHGIADAALSWDKSEHVDVDVAAECDPTAYCVVFDHPSGYDRDWLGYWQPVAKHVSSVQLNRTHEAAHVPRAQQWVACHELGHALGLGETYEGAPGCMVDDYKRPDLPTGATERDLRMVDAVAQSRAPEGTALRFYSSAA